MLCINLFDARETLCYDSAMVRELCVAAACAVSICGAWQAADPALLLSSDSAVAALDKKKAAALIKDLKNNNMNADTKGVTPLMRAAEADMRLAVCYMLARGADATAKDKAGKTALDYAKSEPLRMLLRQCMNLGVAMAYEEREKQLHNSGLSDPEKRHERLWLLLSKPDARLSEIAEIISLKEDWMCLSPDGKTFRDARNLSPEFLAYLVRKGFPVNTPNAEGKVTLDGDMLPATAKLALALGLTPAADDAPSLIWAVVYADDVKTAGELLQKDKKTAKITSASGRYTLLHRAQSAEMVKTLTAAGADASQEQLLGMVIDEQMAGKNEAAVVRALAEAGAPVQADMLLRLCKLGSADKGTAAVLAKAGADVNSKDSESGNTPLHYAARHGKAAIAKWLLSNKADIEAVNHDGDTPLLLAIRSHSHAQPEIVKLLISEGANPKAKTADGKSAAQLAKDLGRDSLIKLLKKKKP